MRVKLELVLAIIVISTGISITYAFGESSSEWKSDYKVGILNQNSESLIPVKVSTFSLDAFKLEWEPPEIQKNEIISGYKILRKDMNSGFRVIIENTNSKDLFYVDKNLPDGYYAYKIVPIIDKEKPDKITMHGIERMSNIFETYKKGQELLAKQVWDGQKIQSYLPNSQSIEFKGIERMNNPVFQGIIMDEAFKAKQIFEKLFNVKANH